jgi:hypothetical protein
MLAKLEAMNPANAGYVYDLLVLWEGHQFRRREMPFLAGVEGCLKVLILVIGAKTGSNNAGWRLPT